MKTRTSVSLMIATLMSVLTLSTPATARLKSHTKISKAVKKDSSQKKLSTNVNFEDLLVDGKYQYPAEATTTVENEKDLDDLIGARTHFRDRLNRSVDRR